MATSPPRIAFRALNRSESSDADILPRGGHDSTTSIEAAVGYSEPSKYVHTTTNVFAALYYSREFAHRDSGVEIVAIDLDRLINRQLVQHCCKIIDLRDGKHASLQNCQRARNFAEAHQIVLVEGVVVPREAILGSIFTRDLDIGTPKGRSFAEPPDHQDPTANTSFARTIPKNTCRELDFWAQKFGEPVTENYASRVLPHYCHEIGQGRFKTVHSGRYTRGPRSGYPCVVKKATNADVKEEIFWSDDLKNIKKAAEFCSMFNKELARWQGSHVPRAFMNEASIFESVDTHKYKFLVEPYINGVFLNYNSNSGYQAPNAAFPAALSHFSYHQSDGKFVLCDLQGTSYDCRDTNTNGTSRKAYVFTDPVIHSKKRGQFGPTDLGEDGIVNFFFHHRCGPFCKPEWRVPENITLKFAAQEGSVLMTKGGQLVGTMTRQVGGALPADGAGGSGKGFSFPEIRGALRDRVRKIGRRYGIPVPTNSSCNDFIQLANEIASLRDNESREFVQRVATLAQECFGPTTTQLCRAGSKDRHTDYWRSDYDYRIDTAAAITRAQRNKFADAINSRVGDVVKAVETGSIAVKVTTLSGASFDFVPIKRQWGEHHDLGKLPICGTTREVMDQHLSEFFHDNVPAQSVVRVLKAQTSALGIPGCFFEIATMRGAQNAFGWYNSRSPIDAEVLYCEVRAMFMNAKDPTILELGQAPNEHKEKECAGKLKALRNFLQDSTNRSNIMI